MTASVFDRFKIDLTPINIFFFYHGYRLRVHDQHCIGLAKGIYI